MDSVYAFGIYIITDVQKRFAVHEDLFSIVNKVADPHYAVTHWFPLVAIFDSVFASELLLVTTFGEWFNAFLKWIFMEHRPFWWIKETQYYGPLRLNKPQLTFTSQTCETGPGSPSGHVMGASALLVLMGFWLITIRKNMNNGHCESWISSMWWTVSGYLVLLITISRVYIAAHFPHQCLLGMIIALLTTYYITDHLLTPFLNLEDEYKKKHVGTTVSSKESNCTYMRVLRTCMWKHVLYTAVCILLAFGLYWAMKAFGIDPLWSVKLAFKWCPSPEFLHYNTTPLYTFVESTASMFGLAICLTPSVKSYRYNTRTRSLIIAAISSILFQQIFEQWETSIDRNSATYFYLMNFFQYALRPMFFIRIVPMLATCRNKWKNVKAEEAKIKTNKKEE